MKFPHKKRNEDEIIMDNGYTISSLEIKRIQEAIEKSDTEKLLLLTRMMRIHFMMQHAIIINKRIVFMDILNNDLIGFSY